MKKIVYIFCAAAVLLGVPQGCQKKAEEAVKTVDLRYRANDSYDLPATGAQSFTILVASTDPWTVTSEHPDWCIISEEEGEASDPELVHTGKAAPTTIRVQYYDNTFLDDRTDKITIQSDYWVGKVITVNQKGIAFLTIPESDLDLSVEKAGGNYYIHINSNQPWSARVTDGDWISITDGASGEGVGTVTVTALDNVAELRYAEVTVYDRHEVASAKILFTQDGVQLVPAVTEVRAGFDQLSSELEITSNTDWVVVKASESDDWFTLENASGTGSGTVKINFTQNNDEGLRKAEVIVKNVVANPEDFQVEKTIVVKQAYKIEPVRVVVDNDELSLWKSDWANAPTYAKGVGTTFVGKARLNRSMAFGSYTFRWSNFVTDPELGGPRIRHWFCFAESCELKADIRPADVKVSFDFNAAGDGNKPSLNSFTAIDDWTQPIELTIKFDPSGAEHCHVTYLVNGVEAGSFDTAPDLLRSVTWNAGINMYFGVDVAGSALCEWYEYTAPMNWDE
ncbi:MAG: BACON domain-containing protein [Bacteroidales bacterium]|nr:BACON domain-containing protein [Bacteroidales bacterium]